MLFSSRINHRNGYSHLLKTILYIGDLFLYSLIFFLSIYMFGEYLSEQIVKKTFEIYSLLILTYAIAFYWVGIVLDQRIIYTDKLLEKTFWRTVVHFSLFLITLFIFKIEDLSRVYLILLFSTIFCVQFFSRMFFFTILKRYRKRGFNFRTVIFIGSGEVAQSLYKEMSEDFAYGYKFLGYFSQHKDFSQDVTHLGGLEEMTSFLEGQDVRVDEVYIDVSGLDNDYLKKTILFCNQRFIRVYIVPDTIRYVKRKLHLDFIHSIPILSLRGEPLMQPLNRFIKRGEDLMISILFLSTLFVPLYILLAVLIKISSPGPVFFKQKRMGINGKYFNCYKFRSMKINQEAHDKQAVQNDPRVTPIGAFMRKSSLDELPQFINVLIGQMSVVGPRPHMASLNEKYKEEIEEYMIRNFVKPGITGWAQISGARGETKTQQEMTRRVELDVWYIENWTFWLDVKIVIKTFFELFKKDESVY